MTLRVAWVHKAHGYKPACCQSTHEKTAEVVVAPDEAACGGKDATQLASFVPPGSLKGCIRGRSAYGNWAAPGCNTELGLLLPPWLLLPYVLLLPALSETALVASHVWHLTGSALLSNGVAMRFFRPGDAPCRDPLVFQASLPPLAFGTTELGCCMPPDVEGPHPPPPAPRSISTAAWTSSPSALLMPLSTRCGHTASAKAAFSRLRPGASNILLSGWSSSSLEASRFRASSMA